MFYLFACLQVGDDSLSTLKFHGSILARTSCFFSHFSTNKCPHPKDI